MSQNMDYFDKLNLLKIIGRRLKKTAESKKISIGDWSDLYIDEKWKKWIAQWDLSNILNWKKWVSSEKLIQIAKAIWISQKQLDEIVKESKKDELRIYYWDDVNIIPDWNINTLENIDFDNEELMKVMFKKSFWKDLSEHDRNEILNFIKFKANK